MRESGMWRPYDPRYLFERRWKNRQKQRATGLMPVADGYCAQFIREGVPAARPPRPARSTPKPLRTSAVDGQRVRQHLGFATDAVVGVYVGKFGDMYYDAEAFGVFRAAVDFFGPSLRLLILASQPETEVRSKLAAMGLGPDRTFVTKAPHAEVPAYLSAADFAFAPIQPAPCRIFCSAVKIGSTGPAARRCSLPRE